jgi:lysophospholipid acyltransferase (LPLAT)-like uncharacterized protein
VKINSPFANNLLGLLGAAAIHGWMGSIDHKLACYDPTVDPAHPDCRGQKIYVFWHEYILTPVFLRQDCNVTMLLSRHRDAELLAKIAYHFGLSFVRGSSYRGAATALRELMREGRTAHLALTPDGPRGPRRQLAAGPLYLASKLGLPLVCVGIGYDRPWRLRTWDRFAIPRLGSRSRTVFSPEIAIPPNLDHDALERHRRDAERLLNRLTLEAEAWAEAGTAKLNEIPGRPGPIERRHIFSQARDPAQPAVSAHVHLPPAA